MARKKRSRFALGLFLGSMAFVAGGEVISAPALFGSTNGVNLYRAIDDSIYTDFNIDAYRPTTYATYYIDPIAGLDANDGLTTSTPKQNLSSAITTAVAGGLATKFLCKPGVYRGLQGPNGVVINLPAVLIEPWAADPTAPANLVSFIRKSDTTGNNWVLESGTTYRRTTTVSADPIFVFDRYIRTRSIPASYTKAADLASCIATSGTWWRDAGTSLFYVHAQDDRNLVGDSNIELSATGTNFNFIPSQSSVLWMQNVEFGCGDSPFVCNFTTNPNLTIDVYLKNVGMYGARTGNGLSYDSDLTNCTMRIYEYRCWTAYNVKDGFNRHAQGSAIGVFSFANECWTGFNGYDASAANNSTTLHENCREITLNCDFAGSQNRTIHDVTATKRWMLGTTVDASAGTDPVTMQTVVSGHPDGTNNCIIWLDSCIIEDASAGALVAYGASDRIYYTNMSITGLTTAGAGQILAY